MPGENVGSYSITAGTLNALSGSAAANYSATLDPAGAALAITSAAVTATIADQTKVFGSADPAPASIAVTLGGVISNPAIVTWNGIAAIDDTTNVSASLASLMRIPGESVGSYAIVGGSLNALSGSAAANYVATLSTAGNVLAITPFQAAMPGVPNGAGAPVVPGSPGAPVVVPGSPVIPAGLVAVAASAASLAPFLGPIIHGINLSALDPNAAFGASGSTTVAENALGFFDSLPPTAAGLANAGGSAATADPATVTLGEQPSRRCFDVQPLNQLWCRKAQ